LYKGAAQERLNQQEAQTAAAAAAAPAEEPKPKPTAKSRSKSKQPTTASTAPAQEPVADPDAAPEEDGSTAAAPPAPKPKKNRPPPHHRAAARSTRRAARTSFAAICSALPGAAAERHLRALISALHCIDARFDSIICAYFYRKTARHFLRNSRVRSAGIADVLHDRHHRPAQRRKIDAVQTGWSDRSLRWSMTNPASRATVAKARRVWGISTSP